MSSMDYNQINEHIPSSLPEPEELERLTSVIRELLSNDMTSEAVVRFSRLRPPDQADVIGQLDKDSQAKILDWLTPKSVGEIIEELEAPEAVELSQELKTEHLSQVLDETSPDVAADVLRGLPGDLAAETLEQMQEADDVAPLLEYDDDDAGGLMTPEFIALRGSMTVLRAIEFVRHWAEKEDLGSGELSHLFVVDSNSSLEGRISLAQLVLAQSHQLISLLMEKEVISVAADTDQEECARLMERYDISTLELCS